MNEERIVRYKAGQVPKGDTDWARIDAMTDEEIEANALSDPDAQPTDEEFWRDAVLWIPGKKTPVQLRLDPDVLLWFKSQGPRYQTRINAVLRSYMTATEIKMARESKAEYKAETKGTKGKKRGTKK
ncbi:MAG: hypothetical protein FJ320_05075 [SAR202 cluster bacterium]|nr:hypothetical protein [SAR202 cluster bacterium]